METAFRVLLAFFATFRLAELVAVDDGPFGVFKAFRVYWGKRANENALFFNIAEAISCPFCIGIWIAFVCALLVVFHNGFTDFLLLFLGIAGVQSFLQSMVNKRGE